MAKKKKENIALVIMKGAAAGLAGTLAVSLAFEALPRLLKSHKNTPGLPTPDESQKPRFERSTEKLVIKVSDSVMKQPVDQQTRRVIGEGVHWGYGAILGMLYGISEQRLKWPAVLFGAAFGGATGLTDSIVAASMDDMPGSAQNKIARSALHLGARQLFGWVTAMTYEGLSRIM